MARLILILLLLPCVTLVRAQETQRTSELTPEPVDTLLRQNSAAITFERNLSTFNWRGRASLDTSVLGTSVMFREQYTSSVIFIDATPETARRKLQTDQQNVSLLLGQPVSSDFKVQTQWSSLAYSDDQSVGLSNASFHSLLGGFEYSPLPFFSFDPMVGYRWEKQAGVNDRGVSYAFAGRAALVNANDYRITGSAQYHEDRVDPRILERHYAQVSLEKLFPGRTRDTLEFGVSRNRREFYTVADSSIESRIDNVLSFSDLLDYEIDPNVITSVFLHLSSRGLDKDTRAVGNYSIASPQFGTRIEEFWLDTYVQAAYRSGDGRTSATARLYYSERDENHSAKPLDGAPPDVQTQFRLRNEQEQTKDNLTRRTSLSGTLDFPLSWSDRVFLSGTSSILRYDTPSDLNFDDRDELLIALSIGTIHHVNQYLDLAVTLDGNLSHIVYLLKERSANNNFNRVLRLSPRVTYRPFREVATTNAFEVLANYTVYDFEQQVALARSFSYRQFGWMDSTSIQVTGRIGLDFFAYLKLYERGQLKWDEFTERTENSFVDETYAVQVRFAPFRETLFALGIRYFSQTRYSFGVMGKQLDTVLRSIGPTCAILWQVGPHGKLEMEGWYEQKRQTNGTTRSLANMTMTISLNF
jgi:hypothetical protein